MKQLVEKFRAIVSNVNQDQNISILVLEVIEAHPERNLSKWRYFDLKHQGYSYTIFPHYLDFEVKIGDELLLETYFEEGNQKLEWKGQNLSSDMDLVESDENLKNLKKQLEKQLEKAKKNRKIIWLKRLKSLKSLKSLR